jgi:carbamoyltransferase
MQKGNKIEIHSPYLCNVGLPHNDFDIDENEISRVAEVLMKGGIVGVCNGPAEAGPRALGNRSLIALANSQELAKKMSMEIKRREWYRPVAPIMLEKNARRVTDQKINGLARFMLMDFTIKPEYRAQMAGVVHANDTARIQTIANESDNPFMFRLLSYLYERHGILALVNTSFNVQGEPIVHTPEQALESTKRMNLDGLVLNGKFQKMEK